MIDPKLEREKAKAAGADHYQVLRVHAAAWEARNRQARDGSSVHPMLEREKAIAAGADGVQASKVHSAAWSAANRERMARNGGDPGPLVNGTLSIVGLVFQGRNHWFQGPLLLHVAFPLMALFSAGVVSFVGTLFAWVLIAFAGIPFGVRFRGYGGILWFSIFSLLMLYAMGAAGTQHAFKVFLRRLTLVAALAAFGAWLFTPEWKPVVQTALQAVDTLRARAPELGGSRGSYSTNLDHATQASVPISIADGAKVISPGHRADMLENIGVLAQRGVSVHVMTANGLSEAELIRLAERIELNWYRTTKSRLSVMVFHDAAQKSVRFRTTDGFKPAADAKLNQALQAFIAETEGLRPSLRLKLATDHLIGSGIAGFDLKGAAK